ncbi:MAG: nitroreductase family protein [Armatimonadetes bacterium]|nr:nitroreductase family protein [Armatimonadota bacterium]MDW8122761.1 nitroreductase family protein [Armatimonadota bacterium]
MASTGKRPSSESRETKETKETKELREPQKLDFFAVVHSRFSVRAYQKREVEPDLLRKILEAVNQAPSAGNLQAYEIVVIRDIDRKRALARAALDQNFIAEAPVVLVFLANPRRNQWRYGRRGSDLYCLQDATIACAYAQLAATALGLGSCWVGAFDDRQVLNILHCPQPLRPVAILPIGWPDEPLEHRPRRSLSDLVHYERYEGQG